mmetsp:Transcript_13131/g.18888  ORF Transcript_13131/g.18888 Transcript_13131/m.18888 type:complete len:534 (-) Transcript_13131:1153-2754(-)
MFDQSRLPGRILMTRSLLFLFLFVLLSSPSLTDATITVQNTGETYPSYPDRLIGGRFVEGHPYMARLQYLPSDIDLCPPYGTSKVNLTVVQPHDKLPVALLVRGDTCSDYTKLEVAQQLVHPIGSVKFIIIYNTPTTLTIPSEGTEQTTTTKTLFSEIQATRRRRLREEQQPDDNHHPLHPNPDETQTSSQEVSLQNRNPEYGAVPKTNIGVLHVSAGTGADLLRLLNTNQDQVHIYGGPRVLLDGSSGSSAISKFARSILFWIGLSLMLSGCLCSFLLSMRVQDMLLQEQQQQAASQRPTRRRLEMRQVREWLPESIFQPHCLQKTVGLGDEKDENNGNDDGNDNINNNNNNDREDAPSTCGMLIEGECSICLDDYIPGESVLRTLPCGHSYHTQCIARWLTERSSTCPLCKLDLLPDENEEQQQQQQHDDVDANADTDVEMQPLETSNDELEDEADPSQPNLFYASFASMIVRLRRHRQQRRQRQANTSTTTTTNTNTTTAVDEEPLLAGEHPVEPSQQPMVVNDGTTTTD